MRTIHAVIRDLAKRGNGELEFATGYAEPGYTEGPRGILLGDWNYGEGQRIADLAERAGYSVEWADEWATCSNCYRIVRTSPDCYGWTPSYFLTEDGELYCRDCVDAEDYFQALSGDPDRAALPGFPYPGDHGYVRLGGDDAADYETGLRRGQNDSPHVLARKLRNLGLTDFVFRIEQAEQFGVYWSCWVSAEEARSLAIDPAADPDAALPFDIGEELGKALRGEPTPHFRGGRR